MNILDCVLNARAGGAVQRCHTVRHVGEYSNAQHQWGAAMLLWHLYDPDTASRLVWYVLAHDVPEGLVGDTPSTFKTHEHDSFEYYINNAFRLPPVSDLSDNDKHILHSVDKLELHLWAMEQRALGNLFAQEIIDNQTPAFEAGALEEKCFHFWLSVTHVGVVPDRVGLVANLHHRFKMGQKL